VIYWIDIKHKKTTLSVAN